MKIPELREKLKKKYVVRVVAGALVIAVVGSGRGFSTVRAEKSTKSEVSTDAKVDTDSSDDTEELTDSVLDGITAKDDNVDKEESVYLISDASGNV